MNQTPTTEQIRLEALSLACSVQDPRDGDATIITRAERFEKFITQGKS